VPGPAEPKPANQVTPPIPHKTAVIVPDRRAFISQPPTLPADDNVKTRVKNPQKSTLIPDWRRTAPTSVPSSTRATAGSPPTVPAASAIAASARAACTPVPGEAAAVRAGAPPGHLPFPVSSATVVKGIPSCLLVRIALADLGKGRPPHRGSRTPRPTLISSLQALA
jgi:hypothetical protein